MERSSTCSISESIGNANRKSQMGHTHGWNVRPKAPIGFFLPGSPAVCTRHYTALCPDGQCCCPRVVLLILHSKWKQPDRKCLYHQVKKRKQVHKKTNVAIFFFGFITTLHENNQWIQRYGQLMLYWKLKFLWKIWALPYPFQFLNLPY